MVEVTRKGSYDFDGNAGAPAMSASREEPSALIVKMLALMIRLMAWALQ